MKPRLRLSPKRLNSARSRARAANYRQECCAERCTNVGASAGLARLLSIDCCFNVQSRDFGCPRFKGSSAAIQAKPLQYELRSLTFGANLLLFSKFTHD